MSHDESTPETPAPAPTPEDRRDAVRAKAKQVQQRQSRTRLIQRVSLATVIVAVVAAVAVVITWTVSSNASRPMAQPANVSEDGFVVTNVTGVGSVGAEPTTADDEEAAAENEADADGDVDSSGAAALTAEAEPVETETPEPGVVDIRIYVDYLSSGAKDFQVANVQQLQKWVSEDAATLSYYPVAMLTAKSNGTKYSLRAASAAACMAHHSPDDFFKFNDTLLKQQPELDTEGYSDIELADLAQASGADDPQTVRDCIVEEKFAAWAKSATDRALDGIPDTDDISLTGTPMVLVNGTPYVGALDDGAEFAQFVLTVSSDAYYEAAPTPTPTPTP
ncbi:thioredoxin domain-containing protein [Microbacterium aquimaris]|uniref:DsbA family protein n=1 Tax=Microbacterium aquimaris TaxID=459816 RepID=UPI002AD2E105|nr:thioredoxin domain-containing protein [Microbacterium aquimaris]MDZ8276989.1 thioredoxin domain-containing protein [Microbacterium aquimaris]